MRWFAHRVAETWIPSWQGFTAWSRLRYGFSRRFSSGDSVLAEHQSEAVTRCLELLRTRGGVILADDVGLGKSFVAAEVMKAFPEVELIVPAPLVEQWRPMTGARILT